MTELLYVVMAVVRYSLYALQICMLIRAVLSWFPGMSGGALGDFCYTVTEPITSFVGNIIYKIRPLRELPFDLSFFFSYLLICVLLMFL